MAEIVGAGRHRFIQDENWARLPAHIELKAAAVTVDAQDRVFCFNRNPDHPVLVFDRDGNFLASWGAGLFKQPHAIRFAPDGNLWLTDGHLHQFFLFTPEGRLLRTIGERGVRSDTGVPEDDMSSSAWKKVTHGGGPFNIPNDIAVAADGSLFMADGYANARVHMFTTDGAYRFSWGEPGDGEGEFNLPHGIWIDRRGDVLVADRENNRVQVFDQTGTFKAIWPTEMIGPAFFYVDAEDVVYIPEHNGGMFSVLNRDGERLARWGDAIHKSCHGVWGDSQGDIYVVMPGAWGRTRRVVKHRRV
jgi:DNA-binding beta-propeller fold protein YncE